MACWTFAPVAERSNADMPNQSERAETPRTDARRAEIDATFEPAGGNNLLRWYDFARQLERELAAEHQRVVSAEAALKEAQREAFARAAKICEEEADAYARNVKTSAVRESRLRFQEGQRASLGCAAAIRALIQDKPQESK
jgi:hypothetical protein